MSTWAEIADDVRRYEEYLRAAVPLTPTAPPALSVSAVSSAAPADPAGVLPAAVGSVGALSFDATEPQA
jgi:hypothetical protein